MGHFKISAADKSIASLMALGLSLCVACAQDEDSGPNGLGSGSAGGSSAGTRTYSGTSGAPTAGSPAVPIGGSAGAGTGTAGTAGTGTAGTGGASAGTGGTAAGGTAAGSGGAGGSGPLNPAPSVCDGNATHKLTTSKADALVDDFQGSMLSIKWSRFSDVMPVANSFDLLQKTDDGAVATGKSGRYQGTGAKTLASGGYGVGIVFNIAVIKAQGLSCADISDFDGISFWAKSSIEDAAFEVNFVVPATNAVADGGDCTSGCYNHPRTSVQLTNEWKQYTVKFGEVFNGAAPIRDRVQMLAFTIPDAEDWDFSLDEIAWFKGTAPTGPVAP
jgi:hypothetical protein